MLGIEIILKLLVKDKFFYLLLVELQNKLVTYIGWILS